MFSLISWNQLLFKTILLKITIMKLNFMGNIIV